MLPAPPPPGPLPLADEELWEDEPSASLPPAPPLPAAPEAATQAGPPATVAPPQPVPVPVQQAAPVAHPMQPAVGTNLAGQAMVPQQVMYGGQAMGMQGQVMQVPVPMAVEPKVRPPTSHVLVGAGFASLVLASLIVLMAGFGMAPDPNDYTAEQTDDYLEDLAKHERSQARYENLAGFFSSIGPMAVAAGLLMFTTKEADEMPDTVRAVLIGGVLYFLAQLFGGGGSLAAFLALL